MKITVISNHFKETKLETYPKLVVSLQVDEPWHDIKFSLLWKATMAQMFYLEFYLEVLGSVLVL